MRLMNLKEVTERCTISRTQVWRLVRKGDFPQPVKLSDKRIAFVPEEVEAWIEERINSRAGDIR